MRQQDMENRQAEREFRRAIALEAASRYCLTNQLSVEKLGQQRFEWFGDAAVFAQPSGIKPDGLKNDLETQPKPTLILRLDNGKFHIEQTEHTKKYLAQ